MTIVNSSLNPSEASFEEFAVLSTPRTPVEVITLNLQYKNVLWRLPVAKQLCSQIEAYITAFELDLSSSSGSEASSIEISIELAVRFLGYLSRQDSTGLLTRAVLDAFDDAFLQNEDVHSLSLLLSDNSRQKTFLAGYYAALQSVGAGISSPQSKLLSSARDGRRKLFGVCGGQGPSNLTCLKELRELYKIYGTFLDDLLAAASEVLDRLASQTHTSSFFGERGFNVSQWIMEDVVGPREDKIYQAPFSFPLIGLLTLAHFCVTCKILQQTPGEIREAFTGITGHSQGVVIAAMIARSSDWNSFYDSVRKAMEILFCIGFSCHESSLFFSSIPEHVLEECIAAGEGAPTPMLSVRGIDQRTIQALLDKMNSHLGSNEHVCISLINSSDSFVIGGPPRSLCALSAHLRKLKASDGLDQSKIAFNQRKPVIQHQFLPMSSVFHSPFSASTSSSIISQLRSMAIHGNELGIGVYHTCTGTDLRDFEDRDIIPDLVAMITAEVVDWPRVSAFPDRSTIIDFGPGGIGHSIQKASNGAGVQVISASRLTPSNTIGSKADIFTAREIGDTSHWGETFRPRVRPSSPKTDAIHNKMTHLFGYPPIMVAGMTPTTVPHDFVGKIMEAGYHAELACGGYVSQKALESAIISLSKEIPPTTGITCNIIYASPKVVRWQIPLIRDLVRRGYPIHGLTIGAGIPSNDTVKEYIETLGLRHISFKPGSAKSIREVIDIAKHYPDFPIGLQWTGGRAGGHHSFEDFHTPILETYSEIRQCDNVVLIAGSGFGGAEDTYPYLVGDWSRNMGYPTMPYDGILLGSRVMVAKESHTSPEAKSLIVEAQGCSDSEWHGSYTKPTGGIITVKSEMGQPIHKIATRGVMLWSELDQKIFSITNRGERLAELQQNRAWIIDRLNKDFQKPWFAVDSHGNTVELEDMTYTEVLSRLTQLMYVQHQRRWIDTSYQSFVADFSQRTRERLQGVTDTVNHENLRNPKVYLASLFESFPDAKTETLHPEDMSYFLNLCRKRGRKPVNFIPALDEDFETWFKKDSLWQAEDVDALLDQDVQRACVIHGPVAASFSTIRDEPVKNILDSIYTSWVEKIRNSQPPSLDNNKKTLPVTKKVAEESLTGLDPLLIEDTPIRKCYRFPTVGKLPDVSLFRDRLCENLSDWALDCIMEKTVRRANQNQSNPLRSVFVPIHGHDLSIEYMPDGKVAALVMARKSSSRTKRTEIIRVAANEEANSVSIKLTAPTEGVHNEASLQFNFKYVPHTALVKLEEQMVGRNQEIKNFYSKLWLPSDEKYSQESLHESFSGIQTTLTPALVQNFTRAIESNSLSNHTQAVPIDICIVVAWEALVKPLLSQTIDCDLLQLLHRSNEFKYVEGARPLKIGDVLTSSSRIQSVSIHQGNKLVEILAEISRDGAPVVEVLSKFFCKGSFSDFENTISRVREPQFEVLVKSEVETAILASRNWLEFETTVIVGQTLVFDVTTETGYNENHSKRLTVSGHITSQTEDHSKRVGRVSFEGLNCATNPVQDFLGRYGSQRYKDVPLENSGPNGEPTLSLQALQSNWAYARVSKDANPIHTLPVFARFAQLDGVVNHGMGTSAIVLRSLERAVAEDDFSRVRRYSASFEGIVFPGDELKIEIRHTGMREGLILLAVKASNSATGETVLEAEADIEQPTTAYVFTGQGSQEKGMGMQLYESSEAARGLWDRADKRLQELYGFSILDIVRNDPKSITIHFGGARGRKMRDNYLALTIDRELENGEVVQEPLLKDLHTTSQSYTFADPRGLLYSTQFAQPAITLMEMASATDLKSKGIIQKGASYAGHSLGEYSALGAIARVIPMESMVSLVFYRGLAMQTAMERDADGRTEFSMMAVNPSRVARVFEQTSLETLVRLITEETGVLLEIVNFNVEGRQYVCAGHLRALWTLTQVLNTLAASKMLKVPKEVELIELVKVQAEASLDVAEPIELERGAATIPLRGIDVPFHSRYLRKGIPAYRRYLETQILEENIDVDRLASFIPNVMAKPFSTDRCYIEEAAETMQSENLRALLNDWIES